MEIGAAAGLPSGTVHPILARLETVGWLASRWEEIDPRAEGRPARRYYRSASLPLPSEHRWRYRREFLAELHGMTPGQQLHHATGVLSRVWTLRMALTEPERLNHKEATMAKPWRCRLRLHRWQRLRNPQGGWYYECVNCGTQQDRGSMGPPNTIGA